LELQRGLATLPKPARDAIITRAQAQVSALETVYPALKIAPALDRWDDQTIDDMGERFADLPCPALMPDGNCEVYKFRPIACRTMGIPGESNGVVEGACTVQTAVPIIRLSSSLRAEEGRLAEDEATSLSIVRQAQSVGGDELPLPYGFVTNRDSPL
jgi:Fe-S-cluster containining protein